MPRITVNLLSGRTDEQKALFAEIVREAAIDILGARPENVRVDFEEVTPTQ